MECDIVKCDIPVVAGAHSPPEHDSGGRHDPHIDRPRNPVLVAVPVQDLVCELVEVGAHDLELQLAHVLAEGVVEEGDLARVLVGGIMNIAFSVKTLTNFDLNN